MKVFSGKLRFWSALLALLAMVAMDARPALAGLAPSRSSGSTAIASVRDADMVMAQRALEHKIVAQKLRDYGVDPEDVKLRLAGMSDQDLHTLATAAKGLPSGGDATGALIGILIVIVLVLVILKLLNKDVVVR
jgi:hypothetical protein